jgi:hypothetical protein
MCACASLEGLTAGTPAGEVDGGTTDADGTPVDGSSPRDGATFTLNASGPHKLMTTRVGLGPTKVAEFDVSLPPEVWRSLSIEATFGAPGVLTVTVDGIPVVSATPSFGCQDTASFDLVVGLSGSGGPCNTYVDNVVVER